LSAGAPAGATTISGTGFFPEGAGYSGGLYVTGANFDGGKDVQIVTSRSTGVPNVQVFEAGDISPATNGQLDGLVSGKQTVAFNPYTTSFASGAQIAVGDVDGDSLEDLVTAPGSGQTVQVKVFNYDTVVDDVALNIPIIPERSFLGFESKFKNGVSLELGDFDGSTNGTTEQIALGAGNGGTSRVRVFDDFGTLLTEFKAYTSGSTNSPLQIATVDVSGRDELFVAQANNIHPHLIEAFSFNDAFSASLVDSFLETDPAFGNGVFVG
jgi:hypothetical protein